MEMRAAFPDLVRHIPEEHGWIDLDLPNEWPWAQLTLLVTGVGPVNAGIALGRLLGRLQDTQTRSVGVLNIGLAGAFLLEQLPLGCAVVATEEIWPEYGLITHSGCDPRGIGLALGHDQKKPVWDRLRLTPEDHAQRMGLNISRLAKAVGLTVAGVSGTPERAEALRKRYACDMENMEGFALAWACRLSGLPFVQVRVISNLVGSRHAAHWDLSGAKHRLAEITPLLLGRFEVSHG